MLYNLYLIIIFSLINSGCAIYDLQSISAQDKYPFYAYNLEKESDSSIYIVRNNNIAASEIDFYLTIDGLEVAKIKTGEFVILNFSKINFEYSLSSNCHYGSTVSGNVIKLILKEPKRRYIKMSPNLTFGGKCAELKEISESEALEFLKEKQQVPTAKF